MMFCVNCGARLNAGARFCFSCGARVAEWIVADAEDGADGLDEPVEPEGQVEPAAPGKPEEPDGAGAPDGADGPNGFGDHGESAGLGGPSSAAKRDFASASWFVSGDEPAGMDGTPDLEEAPAPMAAVRGPGELAADWAAGQAAEPVGTPEPPEPVGTPADAAADTLPASPWAEEPEPYPAAKVRFVAAPEPAAPGAGPFIKLCPSCGTELEPDDMFCPECGARVWAADGTSAAARSSQNRSAFDTLTAEQAAKPLVDTSAPRHRARRGAVGLVAGIMLLGLLVGVGVAVAMHALSDGSEETEITSIVLAEESSAGDEDDEESADIVNDSVTIVVGDEEDETEEDEEDEDSDSDEQAIYEELAEAYAEALSYDTQVASSSSTFNTHYGNANTAESTRRSYASAAEALLAEIQQAGAAVEALEVPSDSVNYEAWQNIVELYECLEQRESILCEGWDLALSYDDPSSSECSSAVTALMASASDGGHNKYWSRFRELCYTSDGSSDKSGWTQDASGSKIGLVDPSE